MSTEASDRWDHKYSERPGFDCRHPRDVVVRAAALLAPGRALDLACGRGRNAIFLADRGWQVTAVDVSKIALEGISHPNIATVHADLEAGEFSIESGSYDLIVDTFYLERDLFPAIQNGLRVNGVFVAEIPMEDQDSTPMNPRYLVKPEELLSIFAGWKIAFYEESRTAEHQRMTARIIAAKSP